MAKRKRHTTRRTHRRAPRKSFFRSRLFYFLGLAILVVFIAAQSTKPRVSSNVLSESSSGGGDSHGGGGDSSGGGESSGGSSSGGSSGGSSGSNQVQQTTQSVDDHGGSEIRLPAVTPGFHFKLETENGKTQFHVEDIRGNTLHENELDELENELENEGVEISTEDGKFAITRHEVRAVSDLPLSVDKARKQILITTPNGKTVPVILPDAAIENLARVGFLTGFASGSGQLTGTPSGTLTLSTNANGIPVYYVPAFKNEHFLGFIPVQIPVTAEVSAQTGVLMGQQESFFSQILDSISF